MYDRKDTSSRVIGQLQVVRHVTSCFRHISVSLTIASLELSNPTVMFKPFPNIQCQIFSDSGIDKQTQRDACILYRTAPPQQMSRLYSHPSAMKRFSNRFSNNSN